MGNFLIDLAFSHISGTIKIRSSKCGYSLSGVLFETLTGALKGAAGGRRSLGPLPEEEGETPSVSFFGAGQGQSANAISPLYWPKSDQRKRQRISENEQETGNSEVEAERSFSNSLFKDFIHLRRNCHNLETTNRDLSKEIVDLRQQVKDANRKLNQSEARRREEKERLEQTYKRMTCCSCVRHLDSVEREPYLINCLHICCKNCIDNTQNGVVECRLCNDKSDVNNKVLMELLLNSIIDIEVLLLKFKL
ncbi:uncharacterized protein LOC129923725 [Biomphalaria glabrata]|uniref:Uncharacterized protein LOC129923725 n=1 Tax=Biomphalaria glabrata TaxID=6526 RepID=A0A9W2ZB13_BIOGL|nr:uncharacterized protein LOC129923725 [Biomphalaria glabrata]